VEQSDVSETCPRAETLSRGALCRPALVFSVGMLNMTSKQGITAPSGSQGLWLVAGFMSTLSHAVLAAK
jgi:hypothetical protein